MKLAETVLYLFFRIDLKTLDNLNIIVLIFYEFTMSYKEINPYDWYKNFFESNLKDERNLCIFYYGIIQSI